jgi:hypothetical protein
MLWYDEKAGWKIAYVKSSNRIRCGMDDFWVDFGTGTNIWHGMLPWQDVIPDNVHKKIEYFLKIRRLL